jgi:hypothetical protein
VYKMGPITNAAKNNIPGKKNFSGIEIVVR